MPDALPLPLRVLVNGDSAVSWAFRMGGPRADLTFPRAIEKVLRAGGRSVRVRDSSKLAIPVHHLFRTWERDVVHWSPDVVVVAAGIYESIHLYLPHWFERHANKLDRRPGRLRKMYFRGVLRAFWRSMVKVQAKVDALLGRPVKRGRARRAARDLHRYIELVQAIGHPLIVILEIPAPGETGTRRFPGIARRVAEFNKQTRELVKILDDPHVRFIEISPIAHSLVGDNIEAAMGDGIHFSPELHFAIGANLAQLIEEWVHTQPHLAIPNPGGLPLVDDSGLGSSVTQ